MRGQLHDFDLGQVLQVVGLGRQYTGVELREGSLLAGTIFVKSGKVVEVDACGTFGRDGLFKLFQLSNGSFFVFRLPTPQSLPEPVGAVTGLLLEAFTRNEAGKLLRESIAAAAAHRKTQPPTPNDIAPLARYDIPGIPLAPSAARSAPAAPSSKLPLLVTKSVASRPSNETELSREQKSPQSGTMRKHVNGATKHIIAIVSPKGGSGKTTISLNLSLSIARQGRSVVLVDSDINGDVLSCVNSRGRATLGTFDVLLDGADFRSALLNTVLPGFRILPAVGSALPEATRFGLDYSKQWQTLLDALATEADLVIVDTPAGMFGVTHQVLSASTHALAVHQSEVLAQRSFTRFAEGLAAMPEGRRPSVLGVVVNMLQMRHAASLTVFQKACTDLPSEWLFETTIPRSPAFLDASEQGVPLRLIDEHAPPAVAWLFDNLAAEVTTRLGLEEAVRRPQQLLAD